MGTKIEYNWFMDILHFDDPINVFVVGLDLETIDALRADAIIMTARLAQVI